MDWIRLVSNLFRLIPKKFPRDCMLQGYMFASLRHDVIYTYIYIYIYIYIDMYIYIYIYIYVYVYVNV